MLDRKRVGAAVVIGPSDRVVDRGIRGIEPLHAQRQRQSLFGAALVSREMIGEIVERGDIVRVFIEDIPIVDDGGLRAPSRAFF